MNEELFAPIPDVDAYLRRLEMEPPVQPDLAYLERLVYAHQTHVPFENMTSWMTKAPTGLDIEKLFDKIVRNRRGGYCFEMNGLFNGLLTALGYDAWSVRCRILFPGEPCEKAMCLHRGVIVRLEDGLHYVDVGFGGPSSAGAVPVKEGEKHTVCGETFFVKRYTKDWWTMARINSEGKEEDVLQFLLVPESPVDYIAPNLYCGTNPDSVFVKIPFLNLRTPNGNISLTGEDFVIRENGTTTVRKVTEKEEALKIAEEYFGIIV